VTNQVLLCRCHWARKKQTTKMIKDMVAAMLESVMVVLGREGMGAEKNGKCWMEMSNRLNSHMMESIPQ